jgi:rhodanese-related sulfurtransferase
MVKKVIPFPQKVAAPEVIVSRRPRMISVLTASFPGPANWMTGEFLTPPDTVGAAIVHRAILRFVSETILPTEISPQDIQRRIDAGEPLVLIDVREPEEFAITRIEGATLIPMRNIPASLQQLEAKAGETTLIVFCHHGVRSLNVVHWLREQGVPACQSMAGGIDAWSVLVDPSVPRY